MLEEAAVFDGQHGVHQLRRNVLEPDELALGAVLAFEQSGQQLRLKLVVLKGLRIFAAFGDRRNLPAAEAYLRGIRCVERCWTWRDLETIVREPVMSNRGAALSRAFEISGATQVSSNFLRVELVADGNHSRPREDLGCVGEDSSSHSPVDHALVLEVEEGKHRHQGDADADKGDDEDLDQRIAEREVPHMRLFRGRTRAALRRARCRFTIRKFQFDCHVL